MRLFWPVALALLVFAGTPALGVAAADPAAGEIRAVLDRLYLSFSFDAGGQPDWPAMQALFLPGAAFVDPIKVGVPPRGKPAAEFLEGFQSWVATDPKLKAGFRERIVAARIEHFGRIAHAFVTFEGYVPGPAAAKAETRGVDSIQLVLEGSAWKVASFTTQYEEPGVTVPASGALDP